MADRKGERKGARKAAASKPKAVARKNSAVWATLGNGLAIHVIEYPPERRVR